MSQKHKKQSNNTEILLELDETNDIIVENQRGITLLGIPFFSSSFLLPTLDPPNYQLIVSNFDTEDGNIVNKSIIPIPYHGIGTPRNKLNSFNELYPLPWVSEDENNKYKVCNPRKKPGKWYVKLNHNFVEKNALLNNCDDQGWIYGWRFRSKHWKERHGLVRRRIWIKLKR
ncbi:sporulation-specific protein 73 [Monosporozyma servazzii]